MIQYSETVVTPRTVTAYWMPRRSLSSGSPKARPDGGARRNLPENFHRRSLGSLLLYIESMRWVTRKPPKILTHAKVSATKPKPRAQAPPLPTCATPTASSAPTTITEEIALVTDISGVCNAGVTDHTTK